MRRSVAAMMWTMALVAMVFVGSAPAFGQSGSGSTTLSGLIVDSTGAVIPGADVTAKNNATNVAFAAVTDGTGRFTIASVPPGTYTVSVTLMGFKTAIAPDVQVLSATPASVKLTLEVGGKEESVVVTGAADVVQTQSATLARTIDVKQIQQLPVITHTALDYVVSLAGVETSASNTRGSTINGLPTSSMNITLDGINVQDKRGSEGFFMYIRPMMDSVEEITVTTSNAGAEATGAGAANIRMETRAGSNRFSASAYDTWRNQAGTNAADAIARTKHPGFLWKLNTPYWFNKRDLPKTAAGDYFINDTRLQTPGFRIGGPIFKDKMFYFGNYEEFRLPESRSRTRYLMNTAAQSGIFTYPRADGGGNATVNVYDIARLKGQTSTPDPSIATLLADIRAATTKAGAVRANDLNTDQYDFVPSATQMRKFPTVRMDYNVTTNHRLSASYRYNSFNSTPDFLNNAEAKFPGFINVGGQVSGRYMWQGTLHSIFGKLVNEVRVGGQDATGEGSYFGYGVDSTQFNCQVAGCQSAGGKGWIFGFPSVGANGITSATGYGGPSAGVAGQKSFEDTLTWIKGAHSLSFGGSWARISMRNWATTPTEASLTFGLATQDATAYQMLDSVNGAANFPGGINTTYAGYAKNLYAFLTGRVTNYGATYYLQPDGTYKAGGERTNATVADDYGFFASDSWRVKPNLTLTLGLRWEVQLPMTTDGLYSRPKDWQMVYGVTGAGTGSYGQGNLYKPGTLTGVNPIVVPYENSRPAYNTDWNNLAPAVGFAWRPSLKSSLLTRVLSTEPVFRGGFSVTYTKLGTSFFDSNYSGNPGRSRAGSRSATSGTPVWGSDGWPVLLRDTTRLTPSAAPAPLLGSTWTLIPAINESVDIHYPDWPVTSTMQYSFGIQRQLGKSIGLDVRYVGNTNIGGWGSWNMNGSAQWSMLTNENGFLDEFRKAQANLRANIIAGKGNTFAFTGAAGTSPLPIFQAYFAGTPLKDAKNQVAANYTSANYKSSSWYNSLNMYSPNMTNSSGSSGIAGWGSSGLQNGIGSGTGLDANRIAAGLPINFFMANPAVAQGSSYLETTVGNTRFNALQVDMTKRMSHGLMVQANYAFSFGRQTYMQRSLRENWSYINSGGGATHTFKANWVYELPFGKGKSWGSSAGRLLDGFIGGWEIDGIGRVQTGPKFNYGGYRLVGMTEKDLQNMFKFRHETGTDGVDRIFMLPADVITNSTLALYTTSATTATGYAGALPTGRYLAPASGPDCVQYMTADCPGTAITRFITGPKYWKVDMSLVKRVNLVKNLRLEARMDLFNIFDTVNFTPTGSMGSSYNSWQVTSGAQDVNASQDPGGRITQFGLRITW